MKNTLFILGLLIPLTSSAQIGWNLNHISLSYGRMLQQNSDHSNSFELLFNRGGRSCLVRHNYYGLGVSISSNSKYVERGFKAQINPTNSIVRITAGSRLVPYVYIQGNLKRANERNTPSDLNFRPGLGILGHIKTNSILVLTTACQLGYTINDAFANSRQGLVFDFKLGIGLATRY